MRTITLNRQQQREVEILTRLEAGVLDVETAAELLGVSARQVRRLRARFRQDGLARTAAPAFGVCRRQAGLGLRLAGDLPADRSAGNRASDARHEAPPAGARSRPGPAWHDRGTPPGVRQPVGPGHAQRRAVDHPRGGWPDGAEAILKVKVMSWVGRNGDSLSLIHISEPTRLGMISYAVFCLKK